MPKPTRSETVEFGRAWSLTGLGPWFVALALTVVACSGIDNEASDVPTVSGWVQVDFGIDQDFVAEHAGRMEEAYDEFVGGLFDDGLRLQDSGWLKPTYGNRNLLWTLDTELGRSRQQSMLESQKEFSSNYEFDNGSIDAGDASWTYAGYTDTVSNVAADAYRSFVFVCGDGTEGVTVFDWGGNTAINTARDGSIMQLLSSFASRCE